jgi:hypothetical protein
MDTLSTCIYQPNSVPICWKADNLNTPHFHVSYMNCFYSSVILLFQFEINECILLFPVCQKEGLYMSYTSLRLLQYMQWSSILSVIKNYRRHFLKSNFEMLAKLLALCLGISLSMYEQYHTIECINFTMLSSQSDCLIPPLGGLPNNN